MLQPKKPVVKVVKKTTVTAKPKTASQRIGDLTLRDVKNAGEDALNLSTLGAYGAAKKGIKKLTGMKSGGVMKKAKSGGSFPDLNKDGKITKADILKGRGIIAKKGATIKKAQKGVTMKGNPKGYNVSTSPMKTGPYEKRLDTIGGGSTKSVRMLSGKGDVLGQERLGTSGATKLGEKFKREKAYTDERRKYNREFLESREATGKAATKSMKKAKCGTKMKKK